MSEIVKARVGSLDSLSEGANVRASGNIRGTLTPLHEYQALVEQGRVFVANGGVDTTPITFAGAYDANGPDFHLHIPSGTTVIPLSIQVNFDAVGNEATMEIIGLASNTGDPSVTGTGITPVNMRLDGPRASVTTCTVAVDAGGVTDPNANNFYEFWHESRPLTDTVATTENDRHHLMFEWSAFRDGPAPVIPGDATRGSALAVYAASQAGTGFITVTWVEMPSENVF